MASAPKPVVLLISLRLQPFFDEQYKGFIDQLFEKATINRVCKPAPALRVLSEDPPSAVLLTDEALTHKYSRVWDKVLEYVRSGGTAVCMGHFSSFTRPLNILPFFQRAGLPWESGDYHRTTVVLNKNATPSNIWPFLEESYSQKALFLKNVAEPDAWYRPNEESVIESHVFPPDKIRNLDQVPVAFGKIGDGRLGYVGDVNAEEGSHLAVLAMCGLHQ